MRRKVFTVAFDAWPADRAFRCAAAACGAEASVWVRPRIGFCNCSIGVAFELLVGRAEVSVGLQ